MGLEYTQLTQLERNHIERLLTLGKCPAEIAITLGRHKSSISREIRRNAWEGICYFSKTAHTTSNYRRAQASSRMKIDFKVWKKVEAKLKLKWSPEQISMRLKLEKAGTISKTTIYNWIWLDRKAGGILYQNLRISNKYRKKRNLPLRYRGPIQNEKCIETRPKIIEKRIRIGDLEGDTIHFSSNRKAGLLTLSDRVSKLLHIRKLTRRKAAKTATQSSRVITNLKHRCHTLTLDRGAEFSDFKKIEQETGVDVYFAKPYCAAQRGSIENQNGLIRQFFGRDYPMEKITDFKIKKVEALLNQRPRKTLGFLTPLEYENRRTLNPAFKE